MATKLDAAVKGTSSPAQEKAAASSPTSGITPAFSANDPLASLPSSPPQIYLNLLILECSLRTQYLELRARRRQNTFILTLLLLWTSYFTYALFLAPREDGRGVGGSVYWVIEMGEKVAFMGGVITAILVWGTGQWERGVRWPRRWVGVTNRGLRGFNLKIVVVKKGMLREWFDTLKFFLDGGLWRGVDNTNYRFIPPSLQDGQERRNSSLPNINEETSPTRANNSSQPQQEDLSPGGDTVSLLLLPKPFSPSFRENWDLYRSTYWESENARRATLLTKLRAYDAAVLRKARAEAGWFAGLKFWSRSKSRADLEKNHHHHHHHGGQHAAVSALKSERRRSSVGRSGSHSRNSSRASTPLLEPADAESAGTSKHVRRGSTASNASGTSDKRRTKRTGGASSASSSASGSISGSGTATAARMQKLTPATQSLERSASTSRSSRGNTPTSDNDSASYATTTTKSNNPGAEGSGSTSGDTSKRSPTLGKSSPLVKGSTLVRDNSFASVSSFEIEREESVGIDGEEIKRKGPASRTPARSEVGKGKGRGRGRGESGGEEGDGDGGLEMRRRD